MNNISPKALLHSKWTKVHVVNKEKHFMVTDVKLNDQRQVIECIIEAVMSNNEYTINWRELKQCDSWTIGWK